MKKKLSLKLSGKKLISLFLSLLMMISAVPFTAFADSGDLGEISGNSRIDIDVSWHYGHELHTTTVGGTTYPLFCIEYGVASPSSSYLGKLYEKSKKDIQNISFLLFKMFQK